MIQKLFSVNGRITRSEYLISLFICIGCVKGINVYENEGGSLIIYFLIYIIVIWFFFTQGVKRCNDLGKPGWMQWIPFYFLWMITSSGNPYLNEYGANPKFHF